MSKSITMEDVPLSKFHFKMFAFTGGSTFIDSYVIGIIAIAMAFAQHDLEISTAMTGLLAASTLIGIFLGGTVLGYVTDIVGRKKMFVLDLVAVIILSILQFFVTDVMQLILLRFLIGIAVGADYPISGSLMAEFAPKKHRGQFLGGIVLFWFIGYSVSFLVGYLMIDLGDANWRWMLASSAVPAIIILIGRMGIPESPQWLASKGRIEEAQKIIEKTFGKGVVLSEDALAPQEKTSYKDIFRNGYGKRTAFISIFWTLQVAPLFAISIFIPEIMVQFGFADGNIEYLGSALVNMFYIFGLVPALILVEKIGRRPVLVWPFLISSLCVATLAILSGKNASFTVIILVFIVYGIFNTGMNVHQWIYPNELYPTRIRATAMGFSAGFSRIGASISTFLFPIILAGYGLNTVMWLCAILFFIGFVVSYFMAPETKNMSLAEASRTTEEEGPELLSVGQQK